MKNSREILQSIAIAPVWSGHPVGFDLLTHGERQFVAFYDAERKMTVGQRHLGEDRFQLVRLQGQWLESRQRLSTDIGWDSHNSVIMAVDRDGRIHLCGNMHVDPLIYFRTRNPLDTTTFERLDYMVGKNEDRCTYPVFMHGPDGELVFRFRDGASGNGVDYYNVYSEAAQSWSRLVDAPILDGMDAMNAYARMPELGPDGLYHMVWMWRDTPDCATNHDISYARSRDLVHWQAGDGTPLSLPITAAAASTIVDPVPPGGGLINMCQSLGFDSKHRPLLSYHKHDAAGHTQAYCARLEDGRWQAHQLSHWHYRWQFGGLGSIAAEIRLGGAQPREPGCLAMSWWHLRMGSGIWKLDEKTLQVIGAYEPKPADLPAALMRPELAYEDMAVRCLRGRHSFQGDEAAARSFALRWETLPTHRDRPREHIPPPSQLRLYELAGL